VPHLNSFIQAETGVGAAVAPPERPASPPHRADRARGLAASPGGLLRSAPGAAARPPGRSRPP